MTFRLDDGFVERYADRRPPFGYRDAGGTSVGEITFARTYSRLKEDGTKERWHEVCRRVVEGMFSLQKDWARDNVLPWYDEKARVSAEEAYDRLYDLKWSPPGRGLWVMGTPIVMQQRNSAALQNCAFRSTADMTPEDPADPFCFLMEASMLGIGVGFDSLGAEKGFTVYRPDDMADVEYRVPDTREGWVESVRLLLESYLVPGRYRRRFDYSLVRKAGEPIRTFGGTAAGPEPLVRLHRKLREVLDEVASREDPTLDSRAIADVGNLIGVCVVSGNVRRSAEIYLGRVDDQAFLNLKNSDVYPERNSYDPEDPGWAFMSNNSVAVETGMDLSAVAEGIARNGEPGVVWLDLLRNYGRLVDRPDGRDHRVTGVNPCSEQGLESGECCTLVETYLNRHESLEDFQRTLKFAYLYAKTVTLLPTHWPRTNAIMQRNRRIGTGVSGLANFADGHGLLALRTWLDAGYRTVQRYDEIYSEWLCVRQSIKTTTVKPGGTVPLLAGESPGVHWAPGGEYYLRAIRFAKADPTVAAAVRAGYRVEDASESPDTTSVIFFPVHSAARRSEKEVSLFEKANLAVLAQRYWSDNGVSVTLSFDPETEGRHVETVLHMHEGQLKTVSFLPMGNYTFPQMPYTEITAEEYEAYTERLFPIDLEPLYAGTSGGDAQDAVGETYCETDACLVDQAVMAAEDAELLTAAEDAPIP